jgi:signal peptide peptidase SppA
MADFCYLMDRLYNRPHLVSPHYAKVIQSVLAVRAGREALFEGDLDTEYRNPKEAMVTKDGIYVIPIVGGLYHRGDMLDASSGAQSYTNLRNHMFAAIEDPGIKGILLDIDSPGGEAAGLMEFASDIKLIDEVKPVWGIANSFAASAAYGILSACSRVFATPTAEVGSIGVVVMHTDISEMLEKDGVKVTFIQAGDKKTLGNQYEPLSEEAQIEIQTKVDDLYETFVALVEENRPMSEKEIRETQAGTFLAKEALGLGLIDAIAPFEQVKSEMAAHLTPKRSAEVKYSNGVLIHER